MKEARKQGGRRRWAVVAGVVLALLTTASLLSRTEEPAGAGADVLSDTTPAQPVESPGTRELEVELQIGGAARFTPAAPGAAPVNIRIREDVGRLTLSWDPVPQATGYQLQWKRGYQQFAAERQLDVEGGGTTRAQLSLAGGQTHTIRIRATNDGSDGPWSVRLRGKPREGLLVECRTPLNHEGHGH